MNRDSAQKGRTLGAAPRRVLWALLGATHIPALASSWTGWATEGFGAARLGGCVALAATMVFFALKVYGPRWLAFRTSLRSWAAAGLIIAFIHFNALQQDHPVPYLTEASTALVFGALVLVLVGRTRAASLRTRRWIDQFKCRHSVTRSSDTLWFDAYRPHCWTLAARLFFPHAPPA